MLKKIIGVLNQSEAECWRVTEAVEHTAELYFIKKELDIPRIKDITQYYAVVYRDFEVDGKRFRGSSTALLYPGMAENEIAERVRNAYISAGFVKNSWFELADPVQEGKRLSLSDLAENTPEENAMRAANIIFSVDGDNKSFLNSVEIFAVHGCRHIIGSNGLDVSYEYDRVEGEFVAQCVEPNDVEQFRQFGFDHWDENGLRNKIRSALSDVRMRAEAEHPPVSGTYSILLRGEDICEIFNYYAYRSSAAFIAAGYSKWAPGAPVQGKNISGEKLNLSLASNAPFSGEGIPMPERTLMRDGELMLIHGETRYCRYVGVEPTGNYNKLRCANGTIPLKELRKAGVLEPISFSDFQMDEMDGHFKGEIRLALLHKSDGTTEIVTGGAINGSLIEAQSQLLFSKERYEDLSYEGPQAVLIPGVAVAGND